MLSQGLGVYHMANRNTSLGRARKMRVLAQRQIPDLQFLAILPIQIVVYRISFASTFPEDFSALVHRQISEKNAQRKLKT